MSVSDSNRRRPMFRASWVIGMLLSAACGEEPRSATQGIGDPAPSSPATASVAAQGAGKKDRDALAYRDDDFVESARRRDPFRSYAIAFHAKAPDELQRRVVMPGTAVEEMRLIALVTGTPRPKAMLLDPSNVGHVVERGDYLGRPKVIQATGNVSMTLNWRVDRIRENEVVLTQEDPADPSRVALTKILTLHEEPLAAAF